MRIRKLLALSSIRTSAFSDLQLKRSDAASPPSDQPSDPPKQLFDQSMTIHSEDNIWGFPSVEEKMKHKEFGDETLRMEAKKSTNNDIRRIVNICDGGQGFNRSLQSSSSSVQERYCCEENYEFVPLKKRKGSFERNPSEGTMKSKTNKKYGDIVQTDHKLPATNGGGGAKKSRRGSLIMEGSRCSRVNGRGWRCCQPTLVGYSLCEHHLGKGRLRSMATVRHGGDGVEEQPLMEVTKKRTKVGAVKARSMSSLLGQF